MRDERRRSPFLSGNRIVVLLTAAVVAIGLTGLTATAMAGNEATVAKKKKKKKKLCPPGTTRVVVKKKNKKTGRVKKKVTCVANIPPKPVAPTPTPAPGQTLIPGTNSFTFPDTQHHADLPCPACPTQSFTFTNTGGTGTGTLASSIQNVLDPVAGDSEAFFITGDTCSGTALAAGGSCSVTITFSPPSNAGDANYSAILHVIGSPGGDAQVGMAGHAQ
jgi:hypothetical protein